MPFTFSKSPLVTSGYVCSVDVGIYPCKFASLVAALCSGIVPAVRGARAVFCCVRAPRPAGNARPRVPRAAASSRAGGQPPRPECRPRPDVAAAASGKPCGRCRRARPQPPLGSAAAAPLPCCCLPPSARAPAPLAPPALLVSFFASLVAALCCSLLTWPSGATPPR